MYNLAVDVKKVLLKGLTLKENVLWKIYLMKCDPIGNLFYMKEQLKYFFVRKVRAARPKNCEKSSSFQ